MLHAATLRTPLHPAPARLPAWRRRALPVLVVVVAVVHLRILGGVEPAPGRTPERPAVAAAVTARIVALAQAPPGRPGERWFDPEESSETPVARGATPSGSSVPPDPPAPSPPRRSPASSAGAATPARHSRHEHRAGREPQVRPDRLDVEVAARPASTGTHDPVLPAGPDPAPPLYRTRMPPPATLRYEVWRRGERGTGELRWQTAEGAYRLELAARFGDAPLLAQSSAGRIDDAGLAPDRFVDRRARRAAQSVDFHRTEGRVTFSGPALDWPLLAGAQDRLSWMFQLAGIAAAEPARVEAGALIRMAVVGARGDASVWNLRSSGYALVETGEGIVEAVRLVREAWTGHDSGFEIWLDPARGYLPVRATQRSARGEPEFDLRLQDLRPGS